MATKIEFQVGMFWCFDGSNFTVMERNGNTMRVREEWIAEDTWEEQKKDVEYVIELDGNTELAYIEGMRKYSIIYASNAFNLLSFYPEEEISKDTSVDEEEYCPSATRGDYSPSNPWDAPGMSKSMFI